MTRPDNKSPSPGKLPGPDRKTLRRGAALVIVMLLLTIISIIAAEFFYELRIQTALHHNHEARVCARYVARAGQNVSDGLLGRIDPDDGMFNNEIIQLFRYSCMSSTSMTSLGLTSEQEREQQEEAADLENLQNCGAWSLTIPYVLGETPIDLEISDEQGRINLNALITLMPGSTSDPSYDMDDTVFNIIVELLYYQAFRNDLEISDLDLQSMIYPYLWDYVDCCRVEGSFDTDLLDYFDYGDIIIPMKNGPLDTVDELHFLPGMTDKLFAAIKDFLTVYPTRTDARYPGGMAFNGQININAASVEVIYALIRGTTYSGGESVIAVEEALEMANEIVQCAYSGQAASPGGAPPEPGAGAMPSYSRMNCIPQRLRGNALFMKYVRQGNVYPRFFRVRATALTEEDGLQTSIIRIVRLNQNRSITALYYREE